MIKAIQTEEQLKLFIKFEHYKVIKFRCKFNKIFLYKKCLLNDFFTPSANCDCIFYEFNN